MRTANETLHRFIRTQRDQLRLPEESTGEIRADVIRDNDTHWMHEPRSASPSNP